MARRSKGTGEDLLRPSYYSGKPGLPDCLSAIESVVEQCGPYEAFLLGNAIKYLWRYKGKNGIEDLRKAKQYIEWLIERESGGNV